MAIAVDTLKAAEILEDAGFKSSQAKAMINALTPATNELVTKDMLRAELAALEQRLIKWMVTLQITSFATLVGVIIGLLP